MGATARWTSSTSCKDPERVVEVYEATVPVDVILGRFKAARAMSDLHQAATQPLSPHHRLHGIAVRTELEEWAANGRPCAK